MPRKQRFKPSRKPKPIPVEQAQHGIEPERPTVQLDEGARAPDSARSEPGIDPRPHRSEEAEAV